MNTPNLPTYLTLEQAARQYEVAMDALRQAVADGDVRAIRTSEDEMLVAGEDVESFGIQTSMEIDVDLVGNPIRVAEAAKKYGVSHQNLSKWASSGFIGILEQTPGKLTLDEADVKRAAEIFKRARRQTHSSVQAGWILKRMIEQLQA